jgi:hypothetical protein
MADLQTHVTWTNQLLKTILYFLIGMVLIVSQHRADRGIVWLRPADPSSQTNTLSIATARMPGQGKKYEYPHVFAS